MNPINIFKNYWYHLGRWHDAECNFLTYDEGVCNCNCLRNLKKIKELLDSSKPAEKEEHINTTEGLFKLSKGVKTVREKECENCKIETGKYIRVLGTKCSDCGREITPEPKIEPLNLDVLPFRHCNKAQDLIEEKLNELIDYTSSLEKRIKELERR